MQWFYDSSDTDEFEQSIEMRLRRAGAWAESEGVVFDADTAREALRFRHESRDGRLGHWTPELVREFLTEIVPERFTGGVDHYAHVPEALRTWLRFLEHAAVLGPYGSDLNELEGALAECAVDFPAAFTDAAKWGPARITAETALSSDIDPTAPGGLERIREFMAAETAANEDEVRTAAARQRLRERRNLRIHPLPAIEPPDAERTAAFAARSPAARGAKAFLEWLGEGRAVTSRGNLRKADAVALVDLLGTEDDTRSFTSATALPGLNWYMDLVLGTGLAERAGQRLVPVAENTGLVREPLALLSAAWQIEALWLPQSSDLLSPFRKDQEAILRTRIETLLGVTHGSEVPIADIVQRIAETSHRHIDNAPDRLAASSRLNRSAEHLFTALHRIGAVEFGRGRAPDRKDETVPGSSPSRAVPPEDMLTGASARLTDLGLHLLWSNRREAGLVAPSVGELTACSASVMLMSVVTYYGQETGVKEIRRWLAAREGDAGLLLEAIAANPFRTNQSAMLGAAMDAVGPELLDRAGLDHRLAPIATMIGNLRGLVDMGELLRGTESERKRARSGLAEQILETLEHVGPQGCVDSVSELPPESLEGMAGLIVESDHPDRWLVELFVEEVGPLLAGPGDRRRLSLEAARERARHFNRRKRRPRGHRRRR